MTRSNPAPYAGTHESLIAALGVLCLVVLVGRHLLESWLPVLLALLPKLPLSASTPGPIF